MFFQNLNNATPEQLAVVQYCAATFNPTNVAPLFYQGAIAGSEFETYDAHKIYVCLAAEFSNNNGGGDSATLRKMDFYDAANALNYTLHNNIVFWNAVAVHYSSNNASLKNFFFSRLVQTGYSLMLFNGYKLTLP